MKKILLAGIISAIVFSNIYAAGRKKIITPISHDELVVKQKIVEFVNTFPVSSYQYSSQHQALTPAYEYSVGQDSTNLRQVVEEAVETAMDRVFRKLVEGGYLSNPNQPENPDQPTISPESPTVASPILTLFTNSCKGCHTGPNPDGVLSILVEDENKQKIINPNLTQEEKWKIFDRIDGQGLPREKVMPRNADPLPDESVELVREWVRTSGEKK